MKLCGFFYAGPFRSFYEKKQEKLYHSGFYCTFAADLYKQYKV